MKRKEKVNTDTENNQHQTEEASMNESLPDAGIETNDQVAHLEAKVSEFEDKYLRLYSEFENYKKRVSKDRLEQSKFATADAMLAFLPVIDDLERAAKSADDSKDANPLKEGVKLIYSKIKSIAESKGLKEMVSVNTPFDPDLHDAIANIPAASENQKGMVMEEIEKGYYLHDRVIRHAKVVVGN